MREGKMLHIFFYSHKIFTPELKFIWERGKSTHLIFWGGRECVNSTVLVRNVKKLLDLEKPKALFYIFLYPVLTKHEPYICFNFHIALEQQQLFQKKVAMIIDIKQILKET